MQISAKRNEELEEFIDELIERSREKGYIPKAFINMRHRYGTVKAIKRLVDSKEIQSGFKRLRELGLLYLSIEAAVMKFPDEFTIEEQESAKWRLEQVSYDLGLQKDTEATSHISESSDIKDETDGKRQSEKNTLQISRKTQNKSTLGSKLPDEQQIKIISISELIFALIFLTGVICFIVGIFFSGWSFFGFVLLFFAGIGGHIAGESREDRERIKRWENYCRSETGQPPLEEDWWTRCQKSHPGMVLVATGFIILVLVIGVGFLV